MDDTVSVVNDSTDVEPTGSSGIGDGVRWGGEPCRRGFNKELENIVQRGRERNK